MLSDRKQTRLEKNRNTIFSLPIPDVSTGSRIEAAVNKAKEELEEVFSSLLHDQGEREAVSLEYTKASAIYHLNFRFAPSPEQRVQQQPFEEKMKL